MGIFHSFGKCLGTSNGLMFIGGSEMGGSMLGEHRFGEIVDIAQTTLSLCGAEDSVTWVSIWTSDWYMWAPS